MANIVSRVVDGYVFHLSGGVPSFLLLKRNKNKIYEDLKEKLWKSSDFKKIKIIDGKKIFDDDKEFLHFLSNILVF